MSLQDTTTLLVGGSSGIGFATAQEVLRHGGHVILVSRDAGKLAAAQDRLDAGSAVRTIVRDVTDEASVRDLFAELPPLDHLVSTAGGGLSSPVQDVDAGRAHAAFEAKFWSKVYLAKHGAASLRPGGSVTFVSGTLGERPGRGAGITSAANAAINALVRSLALELAPLRVNAVSPGLVDTEAYGGLTPEARGAMYASAAANLAVGRVGYPTEIAQVIALVMQNGFMTGSVVQVNGGATL